MYELYPDARKTLKFFMKKNIHTYIHLSNKRLSVIYLDWLFMFVLPVALLNDPCSRQAAISFSELTLTSVDPANVITPFDVSRICIGGFPGTVTFPPWPFAASGLLIKVGSNKSLTSSFKIYKSKPCGQLTEKQLKDTSIITKKEGDGIEIHYS